VKAIAVVKLEEGTLSIDAAVSGRGLNVEPSLDLLANVQAMVNLF